ncbi:F-box protein SKIP23-like [Tripterygium wilfordii]|uniref:F-box protein SKIP23-like n=1 Tax=Tripterygium wilfordii TaxID=458696 RepID=UPI0018F804C5|nr:F-box protein SKIP23-like [Tripterygium wilfordii]
MVRFDELPQDVVQEISKRLTFLQDYIYLRAACRRFFSSIPPTPKHLPLQLPWLFYPPRQQNSRFFNFSTHKFHHLSFPNTSCHQRECGSSKGFDPSRTGHGFEVESNERVAYYRSGGDFSWRFIDELSTSCVDIMYDNEILYAVDVIGEIMVCNLKSDPRTISIIELQEIPSEIFLRDEMYLVGSADDLFLVVRYLDSRYYSDCPLSRRTRRFDVFRIDRSEQLARWIAVTDVGERALFVGQNELMCFKASEYRGCMGNCIYFPSISDTIPFNGHLGEYDAAIYKLSDGAIESLPSCPRNMWPPPIWVTPNPY